MPLLKRAREDTFTNPRSVKPHFTSSRVGGANLKKRVTIHTDTGNENTLKALKDNNVCLAAALDASKLSYRGLLEDFVLLQKERQELLERVFSMESRLCDQQKIVSEQVRPVFKLLNQAEKNLSSARHLLTTLLTTQSSSECHGDPFSPSLSPIHNAADSYYVKPHSSTLLPLPSTGNEHKQTTHYTHHGAKTFPKTPHPIVAISNPASSMKTDQFLLSCEPKALDFDQDDSVSQGAHTPLPSRSVEPGDLAQFKAEAANLYSICEDANSSYQPLLKTKSKMSMKESRKTVAQKIPKPNNEVGRLQTTVSTARPRRACSTLNISYQEPSLRSKLHFDGNTNSVKAHENPVTCKAAKTKNKNALQDVTNKRH
ncbi:uncharacterized protein LOC135340466 isoform X2 [Halichondria panicea]|uniref:uncharacterized protein LOC135340466 isoform X2 n=1 Tax=Halichondria panicea TaxID=6063 RepID=UPI00312B3E81